MKVLRIRVDGLPLYKETFDVSFNASQRVSEDQESVTNLFGNISINNSEAFIGINASGKTTALKIIAFSFMLMGAFPLNGDYVPDVLANKKETEFKIDFYSNKKIYRLVSTIIKDESLDKKMQIKIVSEYLYSKTALTSVNKTNLFDINTDNPSRVRSASDEYLPDDVSIMIALIKTDKDIMSFINLEGLTNFNLLIPECSSFPVEIISLLDPTVEYIHLEKINEKSIAKLKFFGREEIVLYNSNDLNMYLSSGTIKGIRVFCDATSVLLRGGYLIIDEIENHFNRELVATLLRLFTSKRTNKKGAVIIFSTHYPELLNEIDRNDAIFITKNTGSLIINNLSTLLKRNDLKKSDVYQSNFLGGTAPKYNAIEALRTYIERGFQK